MCHRGCVRRPHGSDSGRTRLGLPSVPFITGPSSFRLPPAPHLLYLYSPTILPPHGQTPGKWTSRLRLGSHHSPSAPVHSAFSCNWVSAAPRVAPAPASPPAPSLGCPSCVRRLRVHGGAGGAWGSGGAVPLSGFPCRGITDMAAHDPTNRSPVSGGVVRPAGGSRGASTGSDRRRGSGAWPGGGGGGSGAAGAGHIAGLAVQAVQVREGDEGTATETSSDLATARYAAVQHCCSPCWKWDHGNRTIGRHPPGENDDSFALMPLSP
jgi:hypothetical protein